MNEGEGYSLEGIKQGSGIVVVVVVVVLGVPT